jgi:hypothetical protein
MILRFYDLFLQSKFILYFSSRVKNTFLTTLYLIIEIDLVNIDLISEYFLNIGRNSSSVNQVKALTLILNELKFKGSNIKKKPKQLRKNGKTKTKKKKLWSNVLRYNLQ